MINQSEITPQWLNQVSKQHRNADKILVEKVIRALLVLEGLVKQKADFVFKGGTALMLHFNSTKRLSIDIDIIVPNEIENLESVLNTIAQEQGFLRKEIQQRSKNSKIKKEDSMSMEIIKQLYDVGNLFNTVSDIETIKTTFYRFAKTEIVYRNSKIITEKDVLEDIYQTSLCIVMRGADGNGNFEELKNGIQRVSSFIFSESYHIEKAIAQASKAAYISTLIKHDAKSIDKFETPLQIKDWQIGEPLNNKLNKFKKSNPEAFFYWYKIYELKKQKD